MNEYGLMKKKLWTSLTDKQKEAYFTEKAKLKGKGKIKKGKPIFPNNDTTDDKEEESSLSKNARRRYQKKINKLKKKLEEKEGSTEETPDTSTADGASKQVRFDLSSLSESQQTMINNLVTRNGGRKVNIVRTVWTISSRFQNLYIRCRIYVHQHRPR